MAISEKDYRDAKGRQDVAEKRFHAEKRSKTKRGPAPVHELSEADVALIREYEAEADRKLGSGTVFPPDPKAPKHPVPRAAPVT